jgi:hypothetical protein
LLWNDFYINLPDGEHDFSEVQETVWNTLVMKLLHETIDDIQDGQIVIKHRSSSADILVGTSTNDSIKWVKSTRVVSDELFLFEDFFDFRNWEDPRALQYVECWSTTLPKEHLLIATEAVDFYYRSRQPN